MMSSFAKKIYGIIRSVNSNHFNGKLSKATFILSGKPFVKKDNIEPSKKFPNGALGGLIISADFEMAWAWRFTKTGADYINKARQERQNLPYVLEILEEFKIPITFATVGHLLLKQCKKGDHDWMARISHFDDHWKFIDGDWYKHDPYSNYKDAPEWYAPDLIEIIIKSKVDHEIGSHTFSHIDFSYKNCSPEVAEDEILACEKAAKSYGLDLKSMVFPGGTWGNIEILKKHNIKIYRRNLDHDLAYPYRDEQDLLVSLSSGCLEYNTGYGWAPEYYVKRLEKYVDKAIKTNTVVHLWFHPSLDPFFLKNVFPGFLDYASKQREMGNLWIGTMAEIAQHINSNSLL